MIYSKDIDKICSLCTHASIDGDTVHCKKCRKKTDLTIWSEGCKYFSYDILKKTVHRKKPLKTDFSAGAFEL